MLIIFSALLLVVMRNMVKTLGNIQLRLLETSELVTQYSEAVKEINSSETYYGDLTIQKFVDISVQLQDHLKEIIQLERELTGDMDAPQKN